MKAGWCYALDFGHSVPRQDQALVERADVYIDSDMGSMEIRVSINNSYSPAFLYTLGNLFSVA